MSERLQIALVGAGHMGKLHACALGERDDALLAAVCDVDPRAAREAAAVSGARVVADVRDLPEEVDAAILAAATSAHRDLALVLVGRRIALLVEKPLAGTAAEAREIADAARDAGAVVQVGHILRFDPVTRGIAGREIRPTAIQVVWRSQFTGRSTDVSVVMDLMIHGIDLVLDWVGEMPDEIKATGETVEGPHLDVVDAHLRFPGGCVAHLSTSRVSETAERSIRITSDCEAINLDYAARTVNGSPVKTEPDALRAQLASFLAAVRGEQPVAVCADEGARAVEVAERIGEAACR
ncbi:MAG TPA: Gfo/Idh/MocA family oxidoreductase [Phycisphaerae bacterium]|nr:Gfo/Idh/MocA family oxidoreductase [Phycisphaerae bacterium]